MANEVMFWVWVANAIMGLGLLSLILGGLSAETDGRSIERFQRWAIWGGGFLVVLGFGPRMYFRFSY